MQLPITGRHQGAALQGQFLEAADFLGVRRLASALECESLLSLCRGDPGGRPLRKVGAAFKAGRHETGPYFHQRR